MHCGAALRFASWGANVEGARRDDVDRSCMHHARENVAAFASCYAVAEVLEEGAQSQGVGGGLHAIVVDLGENM